MYNGNPKRVLTGEVRMSYVHLNEPYANPNTPGAKPKYSATLLIPKTDTETKKQIDDAMNAAYEEGVKNKWKGARPGMINALIYDGDGTRRNGQPFGDECRGHWVITASANRKPGVAHVSAPGTQLLPDEIYSGMYARVTLTFFNPMQGNPVACGLDNVFKTRDGESFAGGPSLAQDAAGLGATGAPQINPITGQPME